MLYMETDDRCCAESTLDHRVKKKSYNIFHMYGNRQAYTVKISLFVGVNIS